MSGYRCASTQTILELFEYNAAIRTPARLMIDAGKGLGNYARKLAWETSQGE